MTATKVTLKHITEDFILDQGRYGTCAENALSHALSLMMAQAGQPIAPISRLQSYADARIAVNQFGPEHGDVGTYPVVMFYQAMKKGLAPESIWDYGKGLYEVPTAEVYAEAAQHKLLGFGQTGLYKNYYGIKEDIKAVLDQGKPIYLSFRVRDYFYEQDGPLETLVGKGSTGDGGGHGVVIVGVDDNLNGGSYIIKNSWGTEYGDNGYGVISYTQFASNLSDFWGAYYFTGFDGLDFTYSAARVNVAQHYAAILERAGDISGVDWWVAANLTDEQLTDGLLNSVEGQSIYGSLTNTQFVQEMYDNVLGRAADNDGLQFYTNALNNGYTRSQIMNMVINAVETSTNDAISKQYLENLTNVSSYISIAMQYDGTQNSVTHTQLDAVTNNVADMQIIKVGLPDALGYII